MVEKLALPFTLLSDPRGDRDAPREAHPLLSGVFFATIALKRRFGQFKDRAAFKEVDRCQQMVK